MTIISLTHKIGALVVFVCCLIVTPTTAAKFSSTAITTSASAPKKGTTSSVGPIRLFPRGFSWTASSNRATGLASSKESSRCSLRNKQQLQQQQEWYKNALYEQRLHASTHDLVSSWCQFLCKGSVSLGLFQRRTLSRESTVSLNVGEKSFELSRRDDEYASSMCPRWMSFSLLTFGKARRMPLSWNGWDIPFEGGLLSLENSNTKERGKLIFEMMRDEDDESVVRLQTQVVDYTPRLGGQAPVPVLRQWVYLHSQSCVHAYVTWRFHRVWQERVRSIHNEFAALNRAE
jgi:hypothetical protein